MIYKNKFISDNFFIVFFVATFFLLMILFFPDKANLENTDSSNLTLYEDEIIPYCNNLSFDKSQENKFYNITILLISLLSALNVLITSGRAGHIVFLALTILLIFQIIKKPIVSLLISITSISLILLFSSIFEFNFSYKLNKTIENLSMNESSSSLARRYYMAENSMEIFQNNFLFGVGSGDFYSEYEKIKSKKNYPFELASTKNPHNMYLLVAAELGIFGLIFLFYFFYVLFKSALLQKNIFYKDSAIALGLSFCILNLSDSYFLGHFSTFIFALLISIFFADIYE